MGETPGTVAEQEPGTTTVIDVFRHSNVDNPDNIYYGRQPGWHLSREGHNRASNLGDYLVEQEPYTAIYCSPLERAEQTAWHIAASQSGKPGIIPDKRILEVRSSRDGMLKSELQKVNFNIYGPDAPDSETVEEVWTRMQEFLEDVAVRHKGGRVAVVTHGDPVMMANAIYTGLPRELGSLRDNEQEGRAYVKEARGFRLIIPGGGASRTVSVEPIDF